MTTTEPTASDDSATAVTEAHLEHEQHEHPSDWLYVKTAIILAVITLGEILLYVAEDDLSRNVVVPMLIGMMIVKFIVVASYFMHLKYDQPIFRRVFYFGLILAVVVYLIFLTSFEFWSEDYFRYLQDL